jgi:hypothetical protein
MFLTSRQARSAQCLKWKKKKKKTKKKKKKNAGDNWTERNATSVVTKERFMS